MKQINHCSNGKPVCPVCKKDMVEEIIEHDPVGGNRSDWRCPNDCQGRHQSVAMYELMDPITNGV